MPRTARRGRNRWTLASPHNASVDGRDLQLARTKVTAGLPLPHGDQGRIMLGGDPQL